MRKVLVQMWRDFELFVVLFPSSKLPLSPSTLFKFLLFVSCEPLRISTPHFLPSFSQLRLPALILWNVLPWWFYHGMTDDAFILPFLGALLYFYPPIKRLYSCPRGTRYPHFNGPNCYSVTVNQKVPRF